MYSRYLGGKDGETFAPTTISSFIFLKISSILFLLNLDITQLITGIRTGLHPGLIDAKNLPDRTPFGELVVMDLLILATLDKKRGGRNLPTP
jgi:hypothetical protein